MNVIKDFYSSTLGKKIVMAATGLALLLFVIGHMLGNLKMFAGQDAASGRYKMDLYAEFLRSIGAEFMGHETFLWMARAGLLLCVILHASAAIQLAALNARAKPAATQRQAYASSNPASRSMLYGGIFIFCFIIFHILHFTTGTLHFNGFIEGAVYANVYSGFQNLTLVAFYVAAMACLSLHLYHGAWSLFQTLGVDSPVWNNGLRLAARITAIVLFIGFCAVPISTGFNMLPQPLQSAISDQKAH